MAKRMLQQLAGLPPALHPSPRHPRSLAAPHTPPTQEWTAVSIVPSVGGKKAARAGGHVIAADGCGGLWTMGGRDGLGAQATNLLRLRQRAGTSK